MSREKLMSTPGSVQTHTEDCYPARVRLRSVNLTVRLAVEFWGLCWLLGFLSAYLSNGAATMGGLSAVLAWWIAIWRQERREGQRSGCSTVSCS